MAGPKLLASQVSFIHEEDDISDDELRSFLGTLDWVGFRYIVRRGDESLKQAF